MKIKSWNQFIIENVQKSKALVSQKMKDYETLKDRLTKDNTLGYLGKFTDFLLSGQSLNSILEIYEILINNKKTKNIKIDIDSITTLENLYDTIEKKEFEYKVKQTLSKFPSKQKAFFVGAKQDELNVLAKLAEVDASVFLRKITDYNDKITLIGTAKNFLSSLAGPYDKEYFKSLQDENLKLIKEGEDFLIFQTKSVEAVNKIAADTAWCIRKPSYFANYTANRKKQYVIINYSVERFDLMFKIGVTLYPHGVVAYAHDVIDNSIIAETKKFFEDRGIDTQDIYVPDRKTTSDFNQMNKMQLLDFVTRTQLTADEIDQILERVLKLPAKEILDYNKYAHKILLKLFHKITKVKLLTNDEIDQMLNGSSIDTKEKIKKFKEVFHNYFVPDINELTIQSFCEREKIIHFLDDVKHDIFKIHGYTEKYGNYLIFSYFKKLCDKTKNYELMKRLIELSKSEIKNSLLVLLEVLINAKQPAKAELDEIKEKVPIEKYEVLLDDCRISRPFDEDSFYAAYKFSYSYDNNNYVEFPKDVVITKLGNKQYNNKLVRQVNKSGSNITFRVSSEDVLKNLTKYPDRPFLFEIDEVLNNVYKRDGFKWKKTVEFPLIIKKDGFTLEITK